jgi:hypothetical protein
MASEQHLSMGWVGPPRPPVPPRGYGAAWGTPFLSATEVVRYGQLNFRRNTGFAEFY